MKVYLEIHRQPGLHIYLKQPSQMSSSPFSGFLFTATSVSTLVYLGHIPASMGELNHCKTWEWRSGKTRGSGSALASKGALSSCSTIPSHPTLTSPLVHWVESPVHVRQPPPGPPHHQHNDQHLRHYDCCCRWFHLGASRGQIRHLARVSNQCTLIRVVQQRVERDIGSKNSLLIYRQMKMRPGEVLVDRLESIEDTKVW